jgi:uncharacterized protein YdeI (YjbR/CyaY-like superfamily)
VRSDVLRNQNLFEGSSEADQLRQSLERCERLREYFEAVDSKRREPVGTPEEAEQKIEELKALSATYRSELSEPQCKVTTDAIAAVQQEVTRQSDAAIKWLDECETSAKDGRKLDELLTKLNMPPTFLSEDHRPRLEALKGEVKRRSECKQLEAAELATLKTLPPKGSLVELKKQMDIVKTLSSPTEVVGQRVREKISALTRELERLEQFGSAIAERLKGVLDIRSLEQVRSDVLRNQNLFEGSSEAGELRQSLERCERLREYFEAVDSKRREPVGTPEQAEQKIEELKALSATYRSEFSDPQCKVTSDAIAAVEQEATRQSEAAIKWLDECEALATAGKDPIEFAQRLNSPPAFLSESLKCRLTAIAEQNNRRIDDDQVLRVEVHFRKIGDVLKRRECLDRLRALMDEK